MRMCTHAQRKGSEDAPTALVGPRGEDSQSQGRGQLCILFPISFCVLFETFYNNGFVKYFYNLKKLKENLNNAFRSKN